jgi:hypothetical protein
VYGTGHTCFVIKALQQVMLVKHGLLKSFPFHGKVRNCMSGATHGVGR